MTDQFNKVHEQWIKERTAHAQEELREQERLTAKGATNEEFINAFEKLTKKRNEINARYTLKSKKAEEQESIEKQINAKVEEIMRWAQDVARESGDNDIIDPLKKEKMDRIYQYEKELNPIKREGMRQRLVEEGIIPDEEKEKRLKEKISKLFNKAKKLKM